MTVPRAATPADARAIAELLDAFNREFGDPTPGADVLAQRLEAMLARDDVVALLAGDGPDGVALITFRPSVWDDGPVALLEELYVKPDLRNRGLGTELLHAAFALARDHGSQTFEINVDEVDADARRFYERHGVLPTEPGRDGHALYYSRAL
ncbi:MAG TPA: GNAT family N-acetyltransferase [Solirubrobacteraceae bacterium]